MRRISVLIVLIVLSACKPAPRTAATAPVTNTVTVAFVGDVCFDWGLEKLVEAGFDPFHPEVKSILREADIAVYNNEMTVGFRGEPEDKIAHFRCPPATLSLVTNAGFDVASTANNHALDFGAVSLLDTISNLDLYRIRHTGGGSNLNAAIRPVVIRTNGMTVSILAFGYMNPSNLIARANRPGVAPLTLSIITNCIAAARKDSDYVMLFIHWGREYSNLPTYDQRRMAHAAVDAGADLVVGHHPHILQGIEAYGNAVIFYSMGNFCFPQTDHTNLRDSMIGLATIRRVGEAAPETELAIIPLYRNLTNYAPEIRTGAAGQSVVSEIEHISRGLTNGAPPVRFVPSAGSPFYLLEK